jgi:hypothetical protein
VPARTPAPPPSRSAVVLQRLSRLPKLLVPALVLGLTLAGLAAPPLVAVPCLLLVAAFLAWLGAMSWPVLDPFGRLMRVLTVTLLVGAAAARSAGAL